MPVDLKALFPKLTNLLHDAVFVVDQDDQVVYVSDACEPLLGYRADELMGTSISNYVHPDDQGGHTCVHYSSYGRSAPQRLL